MACCASATRLFRGDCLLSSVYICATRLGGPISRTIAVRRLLEEARQREGIRADGVVAFLLSCRCEPVQRGLALLQAFDGALSFSSSPSACVASDSPDMRRKAFNFEPRCLVSEDFPNNLEPNVDLLTLLYVLVFSVPWGKTWT